MAHQPQCTPAEHTLSRRMLLGGAGLGAVVAAAQMSGLSVLNQPAVASQLKSQGKSCILLWLAGGASQLETYDPKPGRPTGGPFAAIPTSVPGVHISELMPKLAKDLSRHTCLIRSLNTHNGDHGGGAELMMRGRRDEAALKYPDLGAVLAKELGHADSQVPDYVSMFSTTEGRGAAKINPGFLGSRYAPIKLTDSMIPQNLSRLEQIDELDHRERADLRDFVSRRFAQQRNNPIVDSHRTAYDRVRGLMASEKLFDLSREPEAIRSEYGPTQFAEQAIIARRLVEAGVPFVRVARGWWDSHGQNFETHLEMVTELDHVMTTLLNDLDRRGLLDTTLVCVFGEFGRTPNINASLGRDHFASAWSASLSGCGIVPGAVYGKTDEDGRTVIEGEVGAAELFATIYSALGIDPEKEYHVGARPVPLVDPYTYPIRQILA